MNFKDFRNSKLVQKVVQELQEYKQPVKIMEVCGSHTMTIGQWGIRKLLPSNIKLISGPGCPVCVTPSSVIDELIELKGVTIATFGDLIRVPGSRITLEQARAGGLDVKTVYSPLEALKLAEHNETVFVGIGFETTIPGIALTIMEAARKKLHKYSLLSLGKLVPPALSALLSDEEVKIDGFILPGHVSVVIGSDAYTFLTTDYNLGGVVTGFEPLDIVLGIKKIMEQIANPRIINEYSRVVRPEGNKEAQAIMKSVFTEDDVIWRGLGRIPSSGLKLRDDFADFDAEIRYNINIVDNESDTACSCHEMLKGKLTPPECSLFGRSCTPENPVGPCMVSSEGSCAAYYKYER